MSTPTDNLHTLAVRGQEEHLQNIIIFARIHKPPENAGTLNQYWRLPAGNQQTQMHQTGRPCLHGLLPQPS